MDAVKYYTLAECAENKAGRYTGIKSKRRRFSHTDTDIKQKILYQQTEIPLRIPVYCKNTGIHIKTYTALLQCVVYTGYCENGTSLQFSNCI